MVCIADVRKEVIRGVVLEEGYLKSEIFETKRNN